MAQLRGGMEFARGRTVPVPARPPRLRCGTLRLSVEGEPAVAEGQEVVAGGVLARAGEAVAGVAPAAGRVAAVLRDEAHADRFVVVLEPGEADAPTALPWSPPARPVLADWRAALQDLGTWPQDGLSVGLRQQLDAARHRPPRLLLGVALDGFPPYPDRSSLLASFRDDVLLGLSLLGRIIGARDVTLAVDRAIGISGLRAACKGFDVRLRQIENAYPWASPTVLLHELTGGSVRLPHEADPMPHGMMLVTPWTAARLARAVTSQELDLCRPVFLASAQRDRALTATWAMPGQALARVDPALSGRAEDLAGRVVLGDPMTGRAPEATPTADGQPGAPALGEADQLLSLLPGYTAPRASPCIHCGWCTDVCPTRLRPIQLVQAFRHSRGEPSLRRQIDWCIDCGLCSHVCPSHIPIAQTLRAARSQLREMAAEASR